MNYRFIFSIAFSLGVSTHAFCDNIDNRFAQLETSSGGRIGIAAVNTANNQQIQYRAHQYFPMGCTAKVIGVAAILKKSMTDKHLLEEKINYKKSDLINWTPITKKHVIDGMTIAELCAAAISYGDNTAMNLLTKKLGGTDGFNRFAHSINDNSFKLDHTWPEEAMAPPGSKEDITTPAAMEKSLHKLILGDVLARPQRDMLTTWLKNNVNGNARIRDGVPKGWTVGDLTGTGFHYGITNDIAVIWPPTCKPIVLALYYTNKDKNALKREDILASATRIVIDTYAQKDKCIGQQLSLQAHSSEKTTK